MRLPHPRLPPAAIRIARCATLGLTLALVGCGGEPAPPPAPPPEPGSTTPSGSQAAVVGRHGGRLVVAVRSEPGSYNPLAAYDRASWTLQRRVFADLVHINRLTQRTEPALAESWTVSDHGRLYTLELRRNVLWSDGEPFDADDVMFTYEVHLDPEIGSPNRDLMVVDGVAPTVTKIDDHTVTFELGGPYAVGDRLFDSIGILPEHRLGAAYREGRLLEAWTMTTPPEEIAGLGPFRPKRYLPGERMVLERNPHYWKSDAAGQRLPYLDELVLLFVSSEEAQVLRFQAGDTDMISDLGAENFEALSARASERGQSLIDLGPSLTYMALFFNLNDLAGRDLESTAHRQRWFRQTEFRRAVSEAIDREAIAQLVFNDRATPIGSQATPGDKNWHNPAIVPPEHSPSAALARLEAAGFRRDDQGRLIDSEGEPVAFSLMTNSSNAQRVRALAVIQSDLSEIGIAASVVAIEFRALLERVLQTFDYEAAAIGLGGGDADPNRDLPVYLSDGGNHLWDMGENREMPPWQLRLDELLQSQLSMTDREERRIAYFETQEIIARELPMIYLVSPNELVGAKTSLGNFRPAVLDHHTLWNVEELFWTESASVP